MDGVVWVVPRRRIGSAGRRRVAGGDGGEGGGEELHRPGCAGTVLPAGDAGETGAAVVGLDFPDGGQDRPVQARTGLGRRDVEPQVVRWDVAAGARARRADRARRTATAVQRRRRRRPRRRPRLRRSAPVRPAARRRRPARPGSSPAPGVVATIARRHRVARHAAHARPAPPAGRPARLHSRRVARRGVRRRGVEGRGVRGDRVGCGQLHCARSPGAGGDQPFVGVVGAAPATSPRVRPVRCGLVDQPPMASVGPCWPATPGQRGVATLGLPGPRQR